MATVHEEGNQDSEFALDIQLHGEQTRREHMSKRAKQQQQQAEAAPMRNETTVRDPSMGTNEDVVLVGNLIGEDHVNYVVQYVDGYLDWRAFHFYLSFSYTDRNCRSQAKIKHLLTDEDFTARHKFSFDMYHPSLSQTPIF
jgi:1-phosphatidylinositol-4-phosphate 5-kinase